MSRAAPPPLLARYVLRGRSRRRQPASVVDGEPFGECPGAPRLIPWRSHHRVSSVVSTDDAGASARTRTVRGLPELPEVERPYGGRLLEAPNGHPDRAAPRGMGCYAV